MSNTCKKMVKLSGGNASEAKSPFFSNFYNRQSVSMSSVSSSASSSIVGSMASIRSNYVSSDSEEEKLYNDKSRPIYFAPIVFVESKSVKKTLFTEYTRGYSDDECGGWRSGGIEKPEKGSLVRNGGFSSSPVKMKRTANLDSNIDTLELSRDANVKRLKQDIEQVRHDHDYDSIRNQVKNARNEIKLNVRQQLQSSTSTSKSSQQSNVLTKLKRDWLLGSNVIGCGFVNKSNNCYLNSIVQAVFHIPAVANWFSEHLKVNCCYSKGADSCLMCTISSTWSSSLKSKSTINLYGLFDKVKRSIPRFSLSYTRQEDAHEFLIHLLESLENAYKARMKNVTEPGLRQKLANAMPLSDLFAGQLITKVECKQCKYVSLTNGCFKNILLDIPNNKMPISLKDAFKNFFSKEHINERVYNCSSCKQKVPFTKQFFLKKAPKVLCIQIKRFSAFSEKIHQNVGYELQTNLNEFFCPATVPAENRFSRYKLISIVNHYGDTTDCGHYTCAAQINKGQFYRFNDEYISECEKSYFLSLGRLVYMFFYELDEEVILSPSTATCTAAAATAATTTTTASISTLNIDALSNNQYKQMPSMRPLHTNESQSQPPQTPPLPRSKPTCTITSATLAANKNQVLFLRHQNPNMNNNLIAKKVNSMNQNTSNNNGPPNAPKMTAVPKNPNSFQNMNGSSGNNGVNNTQTHFHPKKHPFNDFCIPVINPNSSSNENNHHRPYNKKNVFNTWPKRNKWPHYHPYTKRYC